MSSNNKPSYGYLRLVAAPDTVGKATSTHKTACPVSQNYFAVATPLLILIYNLIKHLSTPNLNIAY